MGKLKNNKGITLVMLVVTIIVLLILAGISISAITGGDSAMEQGQKAKNETEIQAEMEELQKIINQSAAKGIKHGNYSGSADSQTIRDALKKNKLIEENPDDVIIDGKNVWKVTGIKTGQKYKIRYDGEVTRIDELAPTKIFAKIEGGVLYLRATEQTGYTEGTKWNDATITKVIIEEPIAPITCEDMFKDCSSVQTIENIKNLHTENVNSMKNMFRGCKKLKSLTLKYFDISNVNNMANMFFNCYDIVSLDFSTFNTDKVTSMESLFQNCNKLEVLNISELNTKNVETMNSMFANCDSLVHIDLSSFNTENVRNMRLMFYSCDNLVDIDLSSFNTQNVSSVYEMFYDSKNLKTIYASENFDVSFLTDNNTYLFYNCISIKGGSGTTYKNEYSSAKYAHIDGGPSNPGYFTLKQ